MKSLREKHRILLLITIAMLVGYIPVLDRVFGWLETFFHEISHGLVAVITGGQIISIYLNLDGSGLCTSRGGWPIAVAFAGYAGSVVWGAMIYSISQRDSFPSSRLMLGFVLILLLATLLLWAQGWMTYLILLVLAGVLLGSFRYLRKDMQNYFFQFLGIFVLLDAIRSPLVLLDGQSRGDGAALSNMTWIPEIVWISIWFLLGCAALSGLVFIWKPWHNKV